MAPIGTSAKIRALINRRTLLWRFLAAVGLRWPFTWAFQSVQSGYKRLKSPVILSEDEAAEFWNPVAFDAVCTAPATDERPEGDVVLKGILMRVPKKESEAGELRAFCLNCPHEFCYVYFAKNSQSIQLENGKNPDHPMLVCPCHFSVFDPVTDGTRLMGPAERGLYRFRFRSRERQVEIEEVEEEALKW